MFVVNLLPVIVPKQVIFPDLELLAVEKLALGCFLDDFEVPCNTFMLIDQLRNTSFPNIESLPFRLAGRARSMRETLISVSCLF